MGYQSVSVTIRNPNNVDLALAEAVLVKLGLRTNRSRMEFINTYNYKDLVLFFKATVNSPINQHVKANIIGRIKKFGYCPVSFQIDDKLVSDIKEFTAVRENKLSDRYEDGLKQIAVSGKNAADGIKKNVAESNNDVDKGAGQAVHGLWNSMTSPVGSKRFGEGLSDVQDGLSRFGMGLVKLELQTPLDAGFILIGAEIDRSQTLVNLENIGRSLNAVEKVLLMSIFGGSILYDEIIIKEGYAGIFNVGDNNGFTLTDNQRALTRGNTIYMKNNPPGSTTWFSTLVHETTHVWQNQNGGTDYMSEALYAQIFGEGYDFDDAVTKRNKTWIMLNPEQQGYLVQMAYEAGYFTTNKGQWLEPVQGSSTKISRPDLAVYMNKVMPQVRAGQGAT